MPYLFSAAAAQTKQRAEIRNKPEKIKREEEQKIVEEDDESCGTPGLRPFPTYSGSSEKRRSTAH
jgi:hypothetical protein